MSPPFINIRHNKRTRRYVWEGYNMDIMGGLAKILGIDFSVYLVPDGKFGSKINETHWSGMVGEVMSGAADVAVAPLTITSQRESVVDFTRPFLQLGLTMLMNRRDVIRKDRTELGNLSYFFNPFSSWVWLLILLSWLVVSLVLLAHNYLNPYEWGYRLRRGLSDEHDHENIGLKQSLWFVFSSFALQGSRPRPMSISARSLVSFWWMFCIVVLATYIVAMIKTTPFVSRDPRQLAKVRNVGDLIKYPELKYGTLDEGSVRNFFRDSNRSYYRRLLENIQTYDSVLDANEKVMEGGHVFIGESSYLDWLAANSSNCDLFVVGGSLEERDYGFAVQENHPLREALSRALLKLRESGKMEIYYRRWFIDGIKCRNYKVDDNTVFENGKLTTTGGLWNDEPPVQLSSFAGPMILLAAGIIVSFIVLAAEFAYYTYRSKKKYRPPFDTSRSRLRN
ncbi:putative glutamate receptor [Tubulanus polymorphus]|uniref:putative glutamate receptor n=1 Tax=Tubulanus polymorphus TaxID=672921 RepID=UPI003DA3A7AA